MKKMLVLDIDGTSVTDAHELTDKLKRVIHLIKDEHTVCIATGRSVSDSYMYYKALDLDTELICHNGGLVFNPINGTVKYQSNIAESEKMLNFLVEHKNDYGIDNVVTSRCNETYLLNNGNEYLHSVMVHPDLPFFHIGKQITKICDIQRIIISIRSDRCQTLVKELERAFSDIIVCGWRGRGDIIDISVGAVSKWTAVHRIAEEKKIMISNIISFGDAINDIELLKQSGTGVCMFNGVEAVKDVADYVTEYDNNHDGVYYFLVNQLSTTFGLG